MINLSGYGKIMIKFIRNNSTPTTYPGSNLENILFLSIFLNKNKHLKRTDRFIGVIFINIYSVLKIYFVPI